MADEGGEDKKEGGGGEEDQADAAEKKQRKDQEKKNKKDLKYFPNFYPDTKLSSKQVFKFQKLQIS